MRKHGRFGRPPEEPQQPVQIAGLPERPHVRLSYLTERKTYLWQMRREPLN
jgi:hypothetical protein